MVSIQVKNFDYSKMFIKNNNIQFFIVQKVKYIYTFFYVLHNIPLYFDDEIE